MEDLKNNPQPLVNSAPKKLKFITPGEASAHEFHRAGYVLPHPGQIIENGYVRVKDGIIVDVGSKKSLVGNFGGTRPVMDHGPGVLMPALVNAHTHFELSALRSRIPFDRGFNSWVRELLIQREQCGVDLLKKEAEKAVAETIATGTGFVGEISTLGITKDILADSMLSGIWFQEYLGSEPPLPETISLLSNPFKYRSRSKFRSKSESRVIGRDLSGSSILKGISVSMAGHAPHTSSPDLLRSLKQHTLSRQLPFSLHVAESRDETEFITTGQGSWASFLRERGIDPSAWPIPCRSPVQYLHDLGVLDPLTIAVHLLNVDDVDLDIIARTGAVPVVCPRSNMNLHGTLPDLPLMLKYGQDRLKPALGTDSPASTDTLNMFDEMAFIVDKFPQIRPSDILAMATINGARALRLASGAGSFEKGKAAWFLHVPLHHSSGRGRCTSRGHDSHGYDPGHGQDGPCCAAAHTHIDIEKIILEIINHHE